MSLAQNRRQLTPSSNNVELLDMNQTYPVLGHISLRNKECPWISYQTGIDEFEIISKYGFKVVSYCVPV